MGGAWEHGGGGGEVWWGLLVKMEKFLLGAEGTVFLFKTDYRRKDKKQYTQSKIGCLFLISLGPFRIAAASHVLQALKGRKWRTQSLVSVHAPVFAQRKWLELWFMAEKVCRVIEEVFCRCYMRIPAPRVDACVHMTA